MIRSKVFNTVLFFLCTTALVAQFSIKGTIKSNSNHETAEGCRIMLNEGLYTTISDQGGNFLFHNIPVGTYSLKAIYTNSKPYNQDIILIDRDIELAIFLDTIENGLDPLSAVIEEVLVTQKRENLGFSRMRAVENLGIYEGKKTEVIIPENLVANLATNNARQVFSRVAGLNIWENDAVGLQLSIGGRGLDPNRSSNFNVRQNGYDISADALGYPESYYTPPIEAVGKIQIVRGAASLQYGTQFGGLINFIMKKPIQDKKVEILARQSLGSFGFYNTFTSASGTIKKLSYYTFFQYKKSKGWRNNSSLDAINYYADIDYKFTDKTNVGLDFTHSDYLSQQPGGLTDAMFLQDPRQTNRERNWFKVNWNLWAAHFDHKFNSSSEFNLRIFGLSAYRYSLGFRPNRVASIDDKSARDLIKGNFLNWGTEARFLKRYFAGKKLFVFLLGARYYDGFNHSIQGLGNTGKSADFNFINFEEGIANDYRFPNNNASVFVENIYNISDKFSITPGIRFEYIKTQAEGFYGNIQFDLAGNIISTSRTNELRNNQRKFLLGGLGLSFKPSNTFELYSNVSQNYRSITFSDMRVANPSAIIDPNLKDEKGYSIDIGVRSKETTSYNFDVSAFYLNYDNRIGEVQFADANNRVLRKRGNIGQAIIKGVEAYGETDLIDLLLPDNENLGALIFGNMALITSKYQKSEITGIVGNKVEFVPNVNLKSGVRLSYKKLKASLQYTYLSDQFTEATNAREGGVSAVVGLIPAYYILDASVSFEFTRFKVEGNVNNLTNNYYYTRRATGYPGPGILPSDGRGVFITLSVKI